MTDRERDQIDANAEVYIKTCLSAIQQLRTQGYTTLLPLLLTLTLAVHVLTVQYGLVYIDWGLYQDMSQCYSTATYTRLYHAITTATNRNPSRPNY